MNKIGNKKIETEREDKWSIDFQKQMCIEGKVRVGNLDLEYRKGISYFGMNYKKNA